MTHRTFTTIVGTLGIAAALCTAWVSDARAHGDVDAQFQKMDTNGDGKVSATEHADGAAAMFREMDTNGDGKVTAAEMDAAHARMDKAMGKSGGHERMEMSSADKIKAMDTNGDGVLTADEHAAGAKAMFEKMDTDHDGYLTKAELRAGHDKWMSKGHATTEATPSAKPDQSPR